MQQEYLYIGTSWTSNHDKARISTKDKYIVIEGNLIMIKVQ